MEVVAWATMVVVSVRSVMVVELVVVWFVSVVVVSVVWFALVVVVNVVSVVSLVVCSEPIVVDPPTTTSSPQPINRSVNLN